ncbi:alpha/beta hydrolase, partial [Staphylococcus simulans]
MENLKLKGNKSHYQKWGQGLFLKVIPVVKGTGDIVLPMGKTLAEVYTVIAVDRRGLGQSHLTAPRPAEVSSAKSEY